jgi:hypothetical protein
MDLRPLIWSSPRTIPSFLFHEYWHIPELLYHRVDRLSRPFWLADVTLLWRNSESLGVARIFLQPRRLRVSLAKIPFIGYFDMIIRWLRTKFRFFVEAFRTNSTAIVLPRNTLAEPDFSSVCVLSRAWPRYLHSLRGGYQLPWFHAFRVHSCVREPRIARYVTGPCENNGLRGLPRWRPGILRFRE